MAVHLACIVLDALMLMVVGCGQLLFAMHMPVCVYIQCLYILLIMLVLLPFDIVHCIAIVPEYWTRKYS